MTLKDANPALPFTSVQKSRPAFCSRDRPSSALAAFWLLAACCAAGVWLEKDVIIGPGAELKTSIVFADSKLAHFNFVGDSILGTDVNLEAGSVIANYRNESAAPEIVVRGQATGVYKFGALIGDHVRIGANAVIAPGALLERSSIVERLALVDQRNPK